MAGDGDFTVGACEAGHPSFGHCEFEHVVWLDPQGGELSSIVNAQLAGHHLGTLPGAAHGDQQAGYTAHSCVSDGNW